MREEEEAVREEQAMKTVSIMLCVNNPDNGMYAGRCAGIEFDDFMELEPIILPEPRCTLRPGAFSIHHCSVKAISHQLWVGNRCWDAITVSALDAARILTAALNAKWDGLYLWGIDRAKGDAAIAMMDERAAGVGPEITVARVLVAMKANEDEMKAIS